MNLLNSFVLQLRVINSYRTNKSIIFRGLKSKEISSSNNIFYNVIIVNNLFFIMPKNCSTNLCSYELLECNSLRKVCHERPIYCHSEC